MIFKIEPPRESGYYWVVDKAYPDPFVAFIQYPILHTMNHGPVNVDLYYIRDSYRYGDMITKPDCKTNQIE
jgi:hypothetical protein